MNAALSFILRLIIVVLLYFFVGWIGYSIFMELRRGVYDTDKAIIPPLSLTASVSDSIQSKQFTIPEITVGRDPANPYFLPDSTISLRHMKLSYHNNQWWAEDLDSTNGSYLNDVPIVSPVVLTNGDELRLGQVFVTVKIN
jgi:pSer/pThr/pTyr-binding forkhead associated (FHA) protein